MNSKSASETQHDWEKQSGGLFRSWLDESRQPNQIEKVTRKCGFLCFHICDIMFQHQLILNIAFIDRWDIIKV